MKYVLHCSTQKSSAILSVAKNLERLGSNGDPPLRFDPFVVVVQTDINSYNIHARCSWKNRFVKRKLGFTLGATGFHPHLRMTFMHTPG
jgi:hypothetical protein